MEDLPPPIKHPILRKATHRPWRKLEDITNQTHTTHNPTTTERINKLPVIMMINIKPLAANGYSHHSLP